MNSQENKSPDKAKLGWNWGAFMFPMQFGIGTKTYRCLFALIPVLNIIWIFVSGFKGSEWAFESGEYGSVKEYNAVMSSWNRAGLVTFIVLLAIVALAFISCLIALLAFGRTVVLEPLDPWFYRV